MGASSSTPAEDDGRDEAPDSAGQDPGNTTVQSSRNVGIMEAGPSAAADSSHRVGSKPGSKEVMRKDGRPRAKTLARKALPRWEDDIENSDDDGRIAEKNPEDEAESSVQAVAPTSPRGEKTAWGRLMSTIKQEGPADRDAHTETVHEMSNPDFPPLKSYEEQVLHLAMDRTILDANLDMTAGSALNDTLAIHDTGGALVPTAEQVGDSRIEAMKDPNYFEVPLVSSAPWVSDRGFLELGQDYPATFQGQHNDAFALLKGQEINFQSLDVELDIMLGPSPKSHYAGLVFRGRSSQECCVARLNAVALQVEFCEYTLTKLTKPPTWDPSQAPESQGFQVYRFSPLCVRHTEKNGETRVELSRIEFRASRQIVSTANATATNPGGGTIRDHGKNFGPEKTIEQNANSKWAASLASAECAYADILDGPLKLDVSRAQLLIQFEHPTPVDEFRFWTSDGQIGVDPVQWVLSGSNDGLQWTVLHCQSFDYATPDKRLCYTDWFKLRACVAQTPSIMPGTWHKLRVRAIDSSVSVFLDGVQVLSVIDTSNRSGGIGIWAGNKSQVQFREFGVLSLDEYSQQLAEGACALRNEQVKGETRQKKGEAMKMRQKWAVQMIEEVAKIKSGFVKQRMMIYTQAERGGTHEQMRVKQLLTWLSLLSVIQKFYTKLQDEQIKAEKEKKFLKSLPPPPPPPPAQDPPRDEDEELHYRYEEMKRKYEPEWQSAGRKMLGKEKFEAMRRADVGSGRAKTEKSRIAQDRLRCAMEVMSEKEHQKYIQKAWTLQNDWVSITDVDPKEIEKWASEQDAKFAREISSVSGSGSGLQHQES